PICDNELIDFSRSLSLAQKPDGGKLKSIPRDACRDLLPAELFTMPKRGFPTPFARWFRQDRLRPYLHDLLLSSRARQRGLFNPSETEKWFNANRSSRLDTLLDYARANRIYSAALLEQWHRIFIDGEHGTRCSNLPRQGAYAGSVA